MKRPRSTRRAMVCVIAALVGSAMSPAPGAPQGDAAAALQRVKDLLSDSENKRFLTPIGGSRSVILAIDAAADLYFYMERGSLRGPSIDDFYRQLEGGEIEAAYRTFIGSSIVTLRATDYGWNGLGVPWITESGTEVNDILFKVEEGAFVRADISAEDRAEYLEMLETELIPALEGRN